MLYFNSDKFDFWKIYDAIKRFYPIGVKKDESKMYLSYPGLKELEDIVIDNIHCKPPLSGVFDKKKRKTNKTER